MGGLHFSLQVEDVSEHTNDECHVFVFLYARERYLLTC